MSNRERAKKIARILENDYGWTVQEYERHCDSCGRDERSHDDSKFCPWCGGKTKRRARQKRGVDEIMDALDRTEK